MFSFPDSQQCWFKFPGNVHVLATHAYSSRQWHVGGRPLGLKVCHFAITPPTSPPICSCHKTIRHAAAESVRLSGWEQGVVNRCNFGGSACSARPFGSAQTLLSARLTDRAKHTLRDICAATPDWPTTSAQVVGWLTSLAALVSILLDRGLPVLVIVRAFDTFIAARGRLELVS